MHLFRLIWLAVRGKLGKKRTICGRTVTLVSRLNCTSTTDNFVHHAEEQRVSELEKRPGPVLAKVLADFPKVNLVSILAGALALISVFLPWWRWMEPPSDSPGP